MNEAHQSPIYADGGIQLHAWCALTKIFPDLSIATLRGDGYPTEASKMGFQGLPLGGQRQIEMGILDPEIHCAKFLYVEVRTHHASRPFQEG